MQQMPIQKTHIYLIALSFYFVGAIHSQIRKGDKFFNNGEYIKAISFYEKELKSKDSVNQHKALVKLAGLYKRTNQYSKAETSYRKLLELNSNQPKEIVFSYAQMLKANNKYEEASKQYEDYLQMSPNDENAKNAMKFCKEIKYYLSRPIEYTIKNVESINTYRSEFSPFVINNKLMFIARKEQFDFVNYSLDDHSGQPFMNMYLSNIEGNEVKKAKNFSKKINSYYHDGSGCVSSNGQTLYFTRVEYLRKKGYVNRSRIYSAEADGESWKEIKPIELNSEDYSIAHPSVDADNSTLYFTSDMPGGYGGKDLYVSKKEGESWGAPVNLGPDINTSGDEMFPTIRKDGILFFSSNGLPGFGGLDIFSAKMIQGKWNLIRNEGMNLNSHTDDFGITFLNDTIGYFSSDREGGKGLDDIYRFRYINKSMEVSGSVLLTENTRDYAKSKKVLLLDEFGNVVDSMYTDLKGFFAFKNLDGDKKYMVSVVEDDPELISKARFYLSEGDSVIHRVTSKYKDSKFVFRNLPIDPNGIPDLFTDDDLVFAGILKYGADAEPLAATKLILRNDYGDVVEEAITNQYGSFAFRNIPVDQNYLITIDEETVQLQEGTKIMLINKLGKDVRTFYKGKSKFYFKVLKSDKSLLDEMNADDVNLVMQIYGYLYDQNKKPIPNAKIRISEENSDVVQDITSSNNGRFNLKNLDADKNYIFEADENNPSLKGVNRIYIADNKGKIYKIVDLVEGKFSFRILEVDKFSLGEFVVEEPAFKMVDLQRQLKLKLKAEEESKKIAEEKKNAEREKKNVVEEKKKEEEPVQEEESEISITIVENIYYAYGDYKISPEAEIVLNKAAEAMLDYPKLFMEISSHTDSKSTNEYNMGLSKRRAQTAVDYLVSKGVSRKRLKAQGYGETKLLNRCGDGVECTEEEHQINRRTEFRVTKPIK